MKGKEEKKTSKTTHDGVGLDKNVSEMRLRHDDLQELVPEAGSPDREGFAGVVGLDGPVVELGGGRDVGVVEVEVCKIFCSIFFFFPPGVFWLSEKEVFLSSSP